MKLSHILLAGAIGCVAQNVAAENIVATDAYRWVGDSIIQGEFKAYAPDAQHLISNYSARPHFYMPIEKKWSLKNDISSYPQLTTPNTLHTAVYNMALDEMVNAVEPDTTLRTGKEWAGVWTRDVSYSIILSMAYLQPEASRISLMKKVNKEGKIIQDTGSGGAWPVSSDRMIWAVAAYELYKVTGDKEWLKYIYPIICRSIDDDLLTVNTDRGLVKGETSFIDWREQSHPKWMQTVDIYGTEAIGTNVVHATAIGVAAKIATILGDKAGAEKYGSLHDKLVKNINDKLWLEDKGYYAMYYYGRNYPIINPRVETLGESLAILYDVADNQRAKTITESNPTTPFGAAIFYPQISDMPSYHNNALWPFVAAYWGLANAKAGNENGVLQAIGSIFRPAALFCTNKENFNLDNGDIYTELNSSNMLWCLSGNLAMTYRILFGIHYEEDQMTFKPFVPKALAGTRTLKGYPYRGAKLNITVSGHGDRIKSCTINGKAADVAAISAKKLKGEYDINIVMADNDIAPLKVNNQPNAKAPLTPITWIENGELHWNPIEYIAHYIVLRNGERIATTRQTKFDIAQDGEYQVIGVSADGIESFASEPRNTVKPIAIQMPGEAVTLLSPEVSYQPKEALEGFYGNGFVEIDHNTGAIDLDVDIESEGTYAITLRYANGNGPVNTENKCAIRTVCVDGNRLGVFVMPTRGVANWNDWGITNPVHAKLAPGRHKISIYFADGNENMNLATNHALLDCAFATLLSE
ncbi:MAG: hypothetical protein ACI4SO_00400 [Muribaculaceae bacterium]